VKNSKTRRLSRMIQTRKLLKCALMKYARRLSRMIQTRKLHTEFEKEFCTMV